jgi:hypothetical protein
MSDDHAIARVQFGPDGHMRISDLIQIGQVTEEPEEIYLQGDNVVKDVQNKARQPQKDWILDSFF